MRAGAAGGAAASAGALGSSVRSRPNPSLSCGFRLLEDGRIGIAPKSIARYKEAVRRLWEARQSLTSKELVQQWQRYVRGRQRLLKEVLVRLRVAL